MDEYERQIGAVFDDLRGFREGGLEPPEQFAALVSAHQYRYLYRLVDEHVPPAGRVLDWGCGGGHFSYHLWKRGCEVTAFSSGVVR